MREFRFRWNASVGRFLNGMFSIFRASGASGDGQTNLDRVHLFAGSFATEAEMFAYCFTPITPNGPEQLNLDLPEASVNTGKIDAVFRDQITPRLSEYFGASERRRINSKLKPGEAVVLIPTRAFDGREFRLHDTPRLRYLGHETSLAMAAMEGIE